MDFKHFQVKALGAGKLEGVASPFGGTPDSTGDVIASTAYDVWLAKTGGDVLICYSHDLTRGIGRGVAKKTATGLAVAITLSMDLQDARDAFIRARDGIASQLSIGYAVDKSSIRRDGVRVLEAITLYEISTVALGAAGDRAAVTSVKAGASDGNADILDHLKGLTTTTAIETGFAKARNQW
jgi:HK97 family phage prohead protease